MTTAERSAFDAYYTKIREPKREGGIGYANGAEDRIVRCLLAMDLDVRQFEVDIADDGRHVAAARYLETSPDYYAFNRPEKSLEHYLAAKLAVPTGVAFEDDATMYYARLGEPAWPLLRSRAPRGAYSDQCVWNESAGLPDHHRRAGRSVLLCQVRHADEEARFAVRPRSSRSVGGA